MKRLGIILAALVLITTATGFISKNQEPKVNQANFKIANEKISVTTVKYRDENYIKLRDFASLNKDRLVDFSLVYKDGKILIDTKGFYEELKDELYPLEEVKGYKIGKTDLYVDEDKHNLSAININDYNYFRLRDLCEIFKVDVSWEQKTKEITLSKKGGEDLNRRMANFKTTNNFSPLNYSGYETKILADGSLQIIFAVKANTGGYSLSTKEVKISKDTIYITPDLRGPKPNQMVTQVISYPTTSIIIDKDLLPASYNIELVGVETDYADK